MATPRKKSPAKRKKAPAKPAAKPASNKPKSSAPRPAPIGNQFWRMRSTHGRKPLFESGEKLWSACEEYFEWVQANPLTEEKLFAFQGEVFKGDVSKMRAMTQDGLYNFLDISPQTWHNYRSRDELSETVAQVERVIRDYKFTGAAADLLNPVIIARDLGLRDGMEHTGAGGGALEVTHVTRTIVDPCKP